MHVINKYVTACTCILYGKIKSKGPTALPSAFLNFVILLIEYQLKAQPAILQLYLERVSVDALSSRTKPDLGL